MTRRALSANGTMKCREVHQHFAHHPNLRGVRQSGDHTVYIGDNGLGVPVPNHNGRDVPKPTLRSILRLAALAGLAVLVVAVVLAM